VHNYLYNEMCVNGFRVVFPSQAKIATIVGSLLCILGMIPYEANYFPFKKQLFLAHTYLISFTWVYQCYSFAPLSYGYCNNHLQYFHCNGVNIHI
jgi:hypothetical protein